MCNKFITYVGSVGQQEPYHHWCFAGSIRVSFCLGALDDTNLTAHEGHIPPPLNIQLTQKVLEWLREKYAKCSKTVNTWDGAFNQQELPNQQSIPSSISNINQNQNTSDATPLTAREDNLCYTGPGSLLK